MSKYGPKKGFKHTEESKRLMSIAARKRKPFTDEHRKKLSLSHMGNPNYWRGKKRTPESKPPSRKGTRQSLETRIKISMGLRGEKNYKFIPDRSLLKKSEKKHLDCQYRYWMLNVKRRDNWKCKIGNEECKGRLEAHHILNWIEYPELRYDENNGITLCAFHHPRGREKEKRMIPELQGLLSVSKIQN